MFDFAFAGKFDHASHHINFRKEDPSLFKRKQPRLSKKSKESSSIQVAVKATHATLLISARLHRLLISGKHQVVATSKFLMTAELSQILWTTSTVEAPKNNNTIEYILPRCFC